MLSLGRDLLLGAGFVILSNSCYTSSSVKPKFSFIAVQSIGKRKICKQYNFVNAMCQINVVLCMSKVSIIV